MWVNWIDNTTWSLDFTTTSELELWELHKEESHLIFEKWDLEDRFWRLIDGEEREKVKLRIEEISQRLSEIAQEISIKEGEFREELIAIVRKDATYENQIKETSGKVGDIIWE